MTKRYGEEEEENAPLFGLSGAAHEANAGGRSVCLWGEIQADQAQGQEGQTMTTATTYETQERGIAALALYQGFSLLEVRGERWEKFTFVFPAEAEQAERDYYSSDTSVHPREFLSAVGEIQGLIRRHRDRRRGEET